VCVCVCVCVCARASVCSVVSQTSVTICHMFTSIKFVTPWRRPKCLAETCSSAVLHTKYIHCATSWQWNLCISYRTAAQKVNKSKPIVTDRLKDFSLWNYYCRLNEEKFDPGSGCTKGSHAVWYLQKVTRLFQSKMYLTKV